LNSTIAENLFSSLFHVTYLTTIYTEFIFIIFSIIFQLFWCAIAKF